MEFNKHLYLKDKHALLSPSKYHWINYTDDKVEWMVEDMVAGVRGTELHAFAAQAIKLRIIQKRSKATLYSYINDAIGYRMRPEQALVYSEFCFGTADAIVFRDNVLRIFDLKTGRTNVSGKQLYVYAALFCLEYDFKPAQISMDLRIYQNDEITDHVPDPDEITHIMDRIVTIDRRIREAKEALL